MSQAESILENGICDPGREADHPLDKVQVGVASASLYYPTARNQNHTRP